ncbi:MAG: chemotaxis protein CheX [Chloroflexi bacterium]|nr:chemotaxis protein CheX [Chloroflexota bacterium]
MAILVKPAPGTLSSELVTEVKAATCETFAGIWGAAPEFEGDVEKGGSCDGVVGIISLVGDVAWSLMVGIPRLSAPAITMSFTGFEVPYDSPDMGDVVGEIANVLAGVVSGRLDAIGIAANLSLPTVVRGSNVEMLIPEGQPSAKLNFNSPYGEFWIKVAVARQHAAYRSHA